MSEERAPYHVAQEPAQESHEHLFRVEARKQDDRSFLRMLWADLARHRAS